MAQQIGVGAGAMPVYERPTYDVPPQVIYRIDDKRYFTIENYNHCDKGGVITYHDEAKGIRTNNGLSVIFPGQFSIEPSDTHIAYPIYSCGNKGCYLVIEFSTDGGKTFDRFSPFHFGIGHPDMGGRPAQSRVAIKKHEIFIEAYEGKGEYRYSKHFYNPGMVYADVLHTWQQIDAKDIPKIRTFSGQDRFHCDTSIRPKNIPAP